jgi:16S rRNA processing protein RimM
MELLEIGRIGRPHGLGGEVAVDLVTNVEGRLNPGAQLFARRRGENDSVPLEVVASRPHGGRYLVTFAEIVDRTDAERFTNATLFAEPSAAEGALFVHELIGASVVDAAGIQRGAVVAVEANPASDLLVLDSGALVPMGFVTDFTDRVVTVEVPEGLFE